MSLLNDSPLSALHYYLTAPYPCSYLPQKLARSQVATPSFLISPAVYSELVRHGFRRSGTFTYRPRCDTCRACVPLRVPVEQFTPNRSQRRAWTQHRNLVATLHPLRDKPEYYDLYQRYQHGRHKDGGMDNDDHESYRNFLLQSHVETVLIEFREPVTPVHNRSFDKTQDRPVDAGRDEPGILRMVSVVDVLDDGLSAVYTFYEPDLLRARYGVYNVLWQIELCRKLGLKYVYLGYWIEACRKMSYKTQYQPAQGLIGGSWRKLATEPTP